MQNKELEIKFFDKFAEEADYDVFDTRGYERILTELENKVPIDSNFNALDMGCGTGAFTVKLLKYQMNLSGVDLSPVSIKLAKKQNPRINFLVGDIENLETFEDEKFDLIILSGVLHHFTDFSLVVSECYRLLRKGGYIFAYDPNIKNPFMFLYRAKKSPFYSSKGVTPNEQPISSKQIKDIFSRFNFNKVEIYPISGVTYKYVESSLALYFIPIYNLIERFFDLPIVRKKFGSFLITIVIK